MPKPADGATLRELRRGLLAISVECSRCDRALSYVLARMGPWLGLGVGEFGRRLRAKCGRADCLVALPGLGWPPRDPSRSPVLAEPERAHKRR